MVEGLLRIYEGECGLSRWDFLPDSRMHACTLVMMYNVIYHFSHLHKHSTTVINYYYEFLESYVDPAVLCLCVGFVQFPMLISSGVKMADKSALASEAEQFAAYIAFLSTPITSTLRAVSRGSPSRPCQL